MKLLRLNNPIHLAALAIVGLTLSILVSQIIIKVRLPSGTTVRTEEHLTGIDLIIELPAEAQTGGLPPFNQGDPCKALNAAITMMDLNYFLVGDGGIHNLFLDGRNNTTMIRVIKGEVHFAQMVKVPSPNQGKWIYSKMSTEEFFKALELANSTRVPGKIGALLTAAKEKVTFNTLGELAKKMGWDGVCK